jgi:hypothetical protein
MNKALLVLVVMFASGCYESQAIGMAPQGQVEDDRLTKIVASFTALPEGGDGFGYEINLEKGCITLLGQVNDLDVAGLRVMANNLLNTVINLNEAEQVAFCRFMRRLGCTIMNNAKDGCIKEDFGLFIATALCSYINFNCGRFPYLENEAEQDGSYSDLGTKGNRANLVDTFLSVTGVHFPVGAEQDENRDYLTELIDGLNDTGILAQLTALVHCVTNPRVAGIIQAPPTRQWPAWAKKKFNAN